MSKPIKFSIYKTIIRIKILHKYSWINEISAIELLINKIKDACQPLLQHFGCPVLEVFSYTMRQMRFRIERVSLLRSKIGHSRTKFSHKDESKTKFCFNWNYVIALKRRDEYKQMYTIGKQQVIVTFIYRAINRAETKTSRVLNIMWWKTLNKQTE